MSNFVTCLRLTQEVFEQYRVDHPKWWKRMDGTLILNDVAVLMAEKFVHTTGEKDTEIERLKANDLEFACWMSDESQVVSGCRDDYERGRYEAFRQALNRHKAANGKA